MAQGSGDRLARGASKAAFGMPVSTKQKDWDKMFEDYDAEKYCGYTDVEKAGNAGTRTGKTRKS